MRNPKPDPDIYMLTMARLGVEPDEALIIEDSLIGVEAATASGAAWICVSTPFSRPAIEVSSWMDAEWVVHDPTKLNETVSRRIEEIEQE